MGLLLAACEMHDPDHLVRRVGFDKEAANRIKGRRRISGHPIAIGREKIDRQMLGEDRN